MHTPPRILVVEDDLAINQSVCERLLAEGYSTHPAYDGPGAVAAFAEVHPELVVLDLMLPGFDGLEVCRRIQQIRAVPVLMVTARDDENDILVGLGVGADDYLTKPFRMRELVARIRALLRRVERARELAEDAVRRSDGPVTVGAVRLEPATRRAFIDSAPVHLTPTEFDLLLLLASQPGEVLTRERLLSEVWGWDAAYGSTRTVDSHVRALRIKIGADRVRTVHGVGYALETG